MKKKIIDLIMFFLVGGLLAGCQKKSVESDHDHHNHSHNGHHHEAPHGGTVVVVGQELYHLELVHTNGQPGMVGYFFDGHFDNFVRVKMSNFTLEVSGKPEPIVFTAVTNNATGEVVGDTAMFVAQDPWLATNAQFEARLPKLEIRGQTFTNITFNFPKGHEVVH